MKAFKHDGKIPTLASLTSEYGLANVKHSDCILHEIAKLYPKHIGALKFLIVVASAPTCGNTAKESDSGLRNVVRRRITTQYIKYCLATVQESLAQEKARILVRYLGMNSAHCGISTYDGDIVREFLKRAGESTGKRFDHEMFGKACINAQAFDLLADNSPVHFRLVMERVRRHFSTDCHEYLGIGEGSAGTPNRKMIGLLYALYDGGRSDLAELVVRFVRNPHELV